MAYEAPTRDGHTAPMYLFTSGVGDRSWYIVGEPDDTSWLALWGDGVVWAHRFPGDDGPVSGEGVVPLESLGPVAEACRSQLQTWTGDEAIGGSPGTTLAFWWDPEEYAVRLHPGLTLTSESIGRGWQLQPFVITHAWLAIGRRIVASADWSRSSAGGGQSSTEWTIRFSDRRFVESLDE